MRAPFGLAPLMPRLPRVPVGYNSAALLNPRAMRTRNPFAYMSGSIGATQKRRRNKMGYPSFPSY